MLLIEETLPRDDLGCDVRVYVVETDRARHVAVTATQRRTGRIVQTWGRQLEAGEDPGTAMAEGRAQAQALTLA